MLDDVLLVNTLEIIDCANKFLESGAWQCFHFAGNFPISGNPDLKRKFSG